MIRLGFLTALIVLQTSGNKVPEYQYADDAYAYDDYADYVDDNTTKITQETALTVNPVIISESENIVVDLGTTIRLPCMVDQLPKEISLIWKRPDTTKNQILAIGDYIQITEYQSRANVEITDKGSVLNIGVATVEDAGEYQCEIGVPGRESAGSVKHTVSIRVAPSITSHSETYIEAEKGQQVLMECTGKGLPEPTVKWTRVGKGKMPDGREEIVGEEFVIRNVNRHHAGVYRCTADNGFSKPAAKDIELRVMYKPEIVVEELFIHTKTGNEAELVCNVHGMPRPKLEWRKDGQPIKEDKNKIKFQNVHTKHSLIISSVEKEDFGLYSCHAASEKGSATQTLEISGLAGSAEFKSKAEGLEETSFLLEWTVVSYSPVTAFRVETRPEGVTTWTEATATPIEDGPYHWAGKLFLKNIESAQRFEARVSGRNEEGWSKPNPVFHFATLGAEPKQEGITGGSSSLVPAVSCLLSILVARLFLVHSC